MFGFIDSKKMLLIFGLTLTAQACKLIPNSTSQEKIINGNYVGANSENKVNAVVRILSSFATSKEASLCTGTIVSDTTIVTAAHCVDDVVKTQTNNLGSYQSCISNAVYQKLCTDKITLHPKYQLNPIQYDVAFITFNPGTFKHFATLRPNANSLSRGDSTFIVGYSEDFPGADRNVAKSDKRWGANKIGSPNTNRHFIGTFNNSSRETAISNGDSGGPMLDSSCRVIGVASHGPKDRYETFYHTNLNNSDILSWIKSHHEKDNAYFCGIGSDPKKCAESSRFIPTKAFGEKNLPCAAAIDLPKNESGNITNTPEDDGAKNKVARMNIAIQKQVASASKYNLSVFHSLQTENVIVCSEKLSVEDCLQSKSQIKSSLKQTISKGKVFEVVIDLQKNKDNFVRLVALDKTNKPLSNRSLKINLK